MRFPKTFSRRNPKAEITTAQPLAISAFLLGALFVVYTPAHAQTAATLLSQMRAAESKTQYSGTLYIVRDGRRETARVYRNGAKRRWEWSAPAFKSGDLLVDNGASLYLYHASENSVTQTQTTPLLPNLGSNWKVAKQSRNGQTNYVLSRGAQQLTLDGKTKVLLRFQNGGSVYALQNVKYGPQPASKFRFQPPAGAKIVRSNGKLFVDTASARATASWLKAPAQLPAGYALESAIAAPDEVWLRYTNGKSRFSLFEQRAEGGQVALTKVEGGWFWKTGGIRYLVSGAPGGAVKGLAASLK